MNLAVRRTPKPHVTIKYLEPDFTELFRKGLRGLAPDGSQDTGFHGRELTRNAAAGDHALATGMRLQEFTYLSAALGNPCPVAGADRSYPTGCRPWRQSDFTGDQTDASAVSEGTAHGRRTMSAPSKVAAMAKGNRSSSRQSATSSGCTP